MCSFTFNFQALNVTQFVQIQTWNVFNAAGEISEYDANFGGWWQWLVDTLVGQAQQQLSSSGTNVTTAQTIAYIQEKLATSICATAQEYCVGPSLQQYENATSCYNFLTQETRFGEAYELGKLLQQSPSLSKTRCNGVFPAKRALQGKLLH